MRRMIAGLRPVWSLCVLVAATVIVGDFAGLLPVPDSIWWVPAVVALGGVGVIGLSIAPRAAQHELQLMSCPVRGEWTSVNTPGQRLPSHGTRLFGQYSAVDVLRPATDSAPEPMRRGLRGSRPQEYPSFDEPVHAMATGTVVSVRGRWRDHRSRNTWAARLVPHTVRGVLGLLVAPSLLFGNTVVVDHGDGTVAAYAHLKRRSATVRVGDRIRVGAVLGRVGSSGHGTEPHLHVQLMDRPNLSTAAGMRLAWHDVILSGGIDPHLAEVVAEPERSAVKDMPPMGEIFTTPWMGGSPR